MAYPRKPVAHGSQGVEAPVAPVKSTVRRMEDDARQSDGAAAEGSLEADDLVPSLSAVSLGQELDAAFGTESTPLSSKPIPRNQEDNRRVPRSSLDKPLTNTQDDATGGKAASRHRPFRKLKRRPPPNSGSCDKQPIENGRDLPLELPLDLRNTEDIVFHSRQAPAVVHETIERPVHEVKHQVRKRDIHEHEVYHRILPVQEVEVRPARHFIEDAHRVRHEISPDSIPGRAPTNIDRLLREGVKRATPPGDRLSGQRGFAARKFASTEGVYRETVDTEGVAQTEQWWVHPPALEQSSVEDRDVYPVHFFNAPKKGVNLR